MMTRIEELREGQQLSLGRNPQFNLFKAVATDTVPKLATDGFAINANTEPIVALLGVRLHAVAGREDGEVYITTVDTSATYTLTLNGNNYTYAASPGDDEEAIILGLIADEATTENATVLLDLATDEDGVKYLQLTGVDGQTWTVAVSATGTGTITALKDATAVGWNLYAYHRDFGWWRVPNLSKTGLTENDLDRYEISGIERLAIVITGTDGRVYRTYAPCELES